MRCVQRGYYLDVCAPTAMTMPYSVIKAPGMMALQLRQPPPFFGSPLAKVVNHHPREVNQVPLMNALVTTTHHRVLWGEYEVVCTEVIVKNGRMR